MPSMHSTNTKVQRAINSGHGIFFVKCDPSNHTNARPQKRETIHAVVPKSYELRSTFFEVLIAQAFAVNCILRNPLLKKGLDGFDLSILFMN